MKQTKESSDRAGAGGNGEEKTGKPGEPQTKESAGEKQDAISLLKADHREVEQLFERYGSVKRRAERAKIVKQACNALTIHAILEEEIFYPACREFIDDEPLDEAQVEHDSAKVLINELINGSPEDPFYDAKFKVLAEQVKHHIQEEEGRSDSIFAKVQGTEADLTAIGEKLKERKAELANLVGQGAPRAEIRSFTSAKKLIQGEEGAKFSQRGRREEEERRASRYRDEDEQGRFMSDEAYDEGRAPQRSYRERDESARERDRGYRSSSQGRSSYEEEYSSRGQRTPDRGEYGRFVSDEEQRGQGRSRAREEEHERRSQGGRHGGWSGDPEGHAEAARKGWEEREGRRSYRDEDERRGSSQGSGRRYEKRSHEDEDEGRGQGGWFGDPEGHAAASRRGWQHRH